MSLTYFEIKKRLSEAIPPVLAIGGEEAGYIADLKKMITKQVVEGPMAELNHDKLSAKEKDLAQMLQLAQTLPMMAPRRLVEISDADLWGKSDKELQMMKEYCQSPCPETVVLLLLNKVDKRQKWVKLLDKSAVLVRCDAPSEREMPTLIQRLGNEMGLELQDEAVDALLLSVGINTLMMRTAIEKLALACPEKIVSVEDVSEHVASTRMEDAFALGRAILNEDRHASLSYLFKLKRNREEPMKILGMLAWQLRQVAQARALLDDGFSPTEIGKKQRLFGYRLDPVVRAARKRPLKYHTRSLSWLAELDNTFKSAGASPKMYWLYLERTILRLCPQRHSA